MKLLLIRTLIIFLARLGALAYAAPPVPAAPEKTPLRATVEFQPREGLPNFSVKLVAGHPVKIAYLGGGITAQARWRMQSLAWFQKRYPQAVITEVNAAIGCTGSELGVYRVAQDALAAKPDLLFVEFAVNGHAADPTEIIRPMERIGPLGRPRPHALGVPLLADNLEGAKIIPLDPTALAAAGAAALDPATDQLATKFARQVPALWKLAPGTALHLRFTGTRAAIHDLFGPDCGELEVTLDGISRTLKRFDGYSTYHRLSLRQIGDRLADKGHEVVIEVLPTVLAKRSIILKTRCADLDTNPTNYIGTNWYVGALLFVGSHP
ncbi:MAG: SGNH/GDSL hydrolase family protein [Undibacterium sp.]|nr:SGNH/GDSL hydrolase family protein [Opitutaceae bacterium]